MIGIFSSDEKNSDGIQKTFFGYDDESLISELYKEAIAVLGPGIEKYDPAPGSKVTKIGEVSITATKDDTTYIVQENSSAVKPEGPSCHHGGLRYLQS